MRALERHDPRTIGKYRVLARISAGGLAMVYFGRSRTGRAVALKAVHTEFAADPAHRARFRHEVVAARAVGGRYSPGVLDADPDAAVPWLAMEFVPSVTLRDAAPLPSPVVWTVAAGLVEALASIHRAGVVHLDLKPANVLLSGDGPRLTDFGIAAALRDGTAHLGVPAGSAGYMAPEQAAGGWVSPASDVFALGATLAFALTGNPRDADVGDDLLRALIEPCLRVDPAERPSLADLAPALAEFAGARLPATVTATIATQAREAENPPADPIDEQAPRRIRRRALLLGAGALVVGGGVTAVAVTSSGDGTASPTPTTTRTTQATGTPTPVTTTSAEPEPRMLEIYAFGDAPVRILTTTVNGDAETVRNVRLPYRRLLEIPEWPTRSTYRIDYHHGVGQFTYKVIADGREYASGGSSSTGGDVEPDPVDGII